MKKMRFLITGFVIVFFVKTAVGQDNSAAKAMYIYNFTRFIEWPADYNTGDFIVGVVGETPVYNDLVKLMAGKNLNKNRIVVKKFTETSDLTRCHIVFVPTSKSSHMGYILKVLTGYRTLIICEQSGMINKGSGISFLLDDAKLKFEINKTNILNKGLYVNSQLEMLAANTPKPSEDI